MSEEAKPNCDWRRDPRVIATMEKINAKKKDEKAAKEQAKLIASHMAKYSPPPRHEPERRRSEGSPTLYYIVVLSALAVLFALAIT